jgi:ATP-binding cassette subfamily B protein
VYPLPSLFDCGYQYLQQILLAIACSVLNKIFDLAPPALIGIAVDVVVKQQDSIIAQWGIKDIFGQFLIVSLLTVITWILESFFEYRYKLFWRNLAQNIQHNLRLDAYRHLQELELAYFEERSTGGFNVYPQ